jgi:S1-C subfamily serine protease
VVVQATSRRSGALGSGFVIDLHGHILTNAHVVVGARSVTVGFRKGGTYPASVVGLDRIDDVAVLDVPKAPRSLLDPLPLGSVRSVQVGDPVVAIGNPLGEYRSITQGIVSAKRRQINSLKTGYKIYNAIQTDAAINHGNSGGPLIDTATNTVIGINDQILNAGDTNDNAGVGFAVPIDPSKAVAQTLISGGTVQHAYLGVAVAPRGAAKVSCIVPNGPAAAGGLKSGDVITSLNGKSVTNYDALTTAVSSAKPGEKVAVTVTRDGSSKQLTVTLGTRPATASNTCGK